MQAHRKRLGALATVATAMLVAATAALAVDSGKPDSDALVSRAPMDLVWISDSVGWDVAPFYARHIRRDLRVKVRVHNEWEGDLAAKEILARLRTRGHPWIRLIRDAEIIFVSGNARGTGKPSGGDCVSGGCEPPLVSGPSTYHGYVAVLNAIYRRIFQIRHGSPVILRTNNWYVPAIYQPPDSLFYPPTSWASCGIVDACTRRWEWLSWSIHRAAKNFGVKVADVYSAFNGPGHRECPVAKGYIQADGIHVNDAGRAVFARTLAKLGYSQVKPPR